MPTYQYACTACDERLEVVQKFSDEPLTECPACSSRLRKVFSPVGVVFKGSGFYRTDSRKDGAAATAGSSKESSGGAKDSASSAGSGSASGSGSFGSGSSGSGSSGSSEAKPAAKSDSGDKKSSGSATKVA